MGGWCASLCNLHRHYGRASILGSFFVRCISTAGFTR
jgi:hypothetical protein